MNDLEHLAEEMRYRRATRRVRVEVTSEVVIEVQPTCVHAYRVNAQGWPVCVGCGRAQTVLPTTGG